VDKVFPTNLVLEMWVSTIRQSFTQNPIIPATDPALIARAGFSLKLVLFSLLRRLVFWLYG